MSNIFAAENNERIRLDNISRTIDMFAKMTNDEKRFATVMPRNHQTCSRPEGLFSVCESHEIDVFAPPPRECCGRLIPRKSSERARARPRLHRGSARRRIAEGAPPRERRDTRRGPIHKARRHAVHRRWGGARARCRRTLSK